MANIADIGHGKRMSSRSVFQDLNNEESADHIEKPPIHENTSSENASILGIHIIRGNNFLNNLPLTYFLI